MKNGPVLNTDGSSKEQPQKAKRKKTVKRPQTVQLPFLLEFTYTFSALILIVLAVIVMITSFLAGASLFNIVIRTGVAMIVMGGLLMLISSQVSSGLLFSAKIDQEEAQRKQEEAALSTSNETRNQVEA